jgi:ATP-dependent protease ClpP protease subunit
MNICNFIFVGGVCAACSLTTFRQTVPKSDPPAEAKPTAIKTDSSSNLVIVIPLIGAVGPCVDGDKWFSATDFEKALEMAENLKPAAIILEINSRGGLVATEERIIEKITESQARGTRIVAWVAPNAGSAAALITIACKEIFVMPTAKVGAAVTIVSGSKGTSSLKKLMEGDEELAAKYESYNSAVHKAAAEEIGRSPAIAAAMRDMSKELWWSSEGGFSETRRTETDELIDGPKEVLTLTAGTMEKTGLAKKKNSRDEVIHSLGMRRSPKELFFSTEMGKNPKNLQRWLKDLEDYKKSIENATSIENSSKATEEYQKRILQIKQLLGEL